MKKIFNANLLAGISALLFIATNSKSSWSLYGSGNNFVVGYIEAIIIALMSCLGIYFTPYKQATIPDKREKLKWSIISNFIAFGLVYIYLIILLTKSLDDLNSIEIFYGIFIVMSYCGILLSIFMYHLGKQMGTYVRFPYALLIITGLVFLAVPVYDSSMIEIINFNIYSKVISNLIFIVLSLNWFLILRKSYTNFISQYKSFK